MKNILILFTFLSQLSFSQTKIYISEGSFTNNCEGPAFDAIGNLYVVNYHEDGTIAKFDPKGNLLKTIKLPDGSIGNGIQFLNSDTAFIVDFVNHRVYRLEPRSMTVSIHSENKAMNQPNDLAIKSDGHIFCSDPSWKNSTGKLWLVNPNGESSLLAENLGTTNGIEINNDETILYVNESVQKNIWAFDILPDNRLSNKRLLIHFDDGGLDGMHIDCKDNLYVTRWGMGKIDIIDKKGQIVESILTAGKSTSNLAFGGKKGKKVVITLQDTGEVEYFIAKNPGKAHTSMKKWTHK